MFLFCSNRKHHSWRFFLALSISFISDCLSWERRGNPHLSKRDHQTQKAVRSSQYGCWSGISCCSYKGFCWFAIYMVNKLSEIWTICMFRLTFFQHNFLFTCYHLLFLILVIMIMSMWNDEIWPWHWILSFQLIKSVCDSEAVIWLKSEPTTNNY